MTLEQALEIVKDHICIGKGMELTNGVPEALEMVVEELAVTQKALGLACGLVQGNGCPMIRDLYMQPAESKPYTNAECGTCMEKYQNNLPISNCYIDYFLQKAKEV
jgi:hypothetical protein